MKRSVLFTGLFLALAPLLQISGQEWTNFTTTNTGSVGIVDKDVRSLLRDADGKIWVGTAEGLSMYNGSTWKTFTKTDGLGSNTINTIFQDATGNIWVGTDYGGASKLTGETFTTYKTNSGLADNSVRSFCQTSGGTIWAGTISGVSYFDGTSTWSTLPGLPSSSGYDVLCDNNDNIWIAGANGLSKYDGTNITTYTTSNGLPDNYTTSLATDNNGNLWIGTGWSGLVKYDGTNFTTYTQSGNGLVGDGIKDIAKDNDGNLWIATYNGISKYNGTTFTNFTKTEGLAANQTNAITINGTISIFFGTVNGISGYNFSDFTTFNTDDGLIDNNVLSVYGGSNGKIVFGTYEGGASIFDGTNWTGLSTHNNLLPGNWVKSVFVASNGDIWFGTSSGAVKFDGTNYTTYTTMQGLSDNDIYQITQDAAGNLWFATSSGITKYNGTTFSVYKTYSGLVSNSTTSIAADGNIIWIGTYSGVSKYDGTVFTNYTTSDGLVANWVTAVTAKSGTVWFGSYGSGISKFDGTNFNLVTTDQGLPSNTIYSLTIDNNNKLWAGTDAGAACYDNVSWETFNIANSSIINNNVKGIFIDNAGKIWFATSNGVSRYTPVAAENPVDIQIGNGTVIGTSLPVEPYYRYSYSQTIYLQAEIGQAGKINAIKYHYNGNSAWTDPIVIFMGHTTKTTFDGATDWIASAGLTQVYTGNLPVTTTPGWVTITLDIPFDFNNTQNLVIAVDRNSTSYYSANDEFYNTSFLNNRSIFFCDDVLNPDPVTPPAGNVSVNIPNTVLVMIPAQASSPLAAFSADVTSGTVPLTVQFTDQSTNSPTSWAWNFGDGATSTSQNPSHTYNTAGTYTVSLTATNAAGSDTEEKTNYIVVSQSALNITIGTGTVTSTSLPIEPYYGYSYSQTIYLQAEIAQAGIINTIKYHFNGNSAWTDQVKVYMGHTSKTIFEGNTDWVPVGNMTQVYAGNLTVTNSQGWVSINLDTPFEFNNTQNLVIAVDENSSGYHSSNDEFFSTMLSDYRSMYYYDDGLNPDPVSPPPGSRCVYIPNTMLVMIPAQVPAPVAAFSATPTSGNAPLAVQFTDQSTNSPTSWAWNFGDGATSTSQNPSHTYNTAGTYTVTLTATNAAGSDDEVKTNYITVTVPAPVAAFSATPTSGTAPLAVQFTDQSTNSPASWAWNFGDGTTSTSQNPSHTYNTAGTYTVTLTATNAGGSDDEVKTNYITVTVPAPVAAFSATPTSGTAPLAVQFTDQSTNSPTSWAWNFGDGATSTSQNPSHTYNAAGTYTVTLTATNTGGSDDEVKTDYITVTVPAPVAAFSATPTSGTAPLAVQFTDQSTNSPSSWAWNFGDGATSTSQNPSHTYNAAGTYTVTLTATNTGGSDDEVKTDYITVTVPAPVAAFSATPTSGTAPLAVQFTDQSTNSPASWAWNFGDGATSTSQNPSHTYNTAGTYTVTLTATNAGGSDDEVKTDYINVSGTPPTYNLPFTQGFEGTTFPPADWVKFRGENGLGTIEDWQRIVSSDAFELTACAKSRYESVSGGLAEDWLVTPKIQLAASNNQLSFYEKTESPVNYGSLFYIKISVAGQTGYTNFSNLESYNESIVSNTYAAHSINLDAYAGQQVYIAFVHANNFGDSWFIDAISITGQNVVAPVAAFSATPTSGTAPLAVQFTDQSTNSPASWAWNFGDGTTSTSQNPSHTYNTAGTYTVTLTATNAAGSDDEVKTNYITVTVPAPVAAFSATPTSGTAPLAVQFTDQSTNSPTSWAWNFGDGATSTSQNPSHTYNTAGTYTVTLTATNAAGSDDEVKTNYITVTVPAPVAAFSATPTSGTAPLAVQFTDQSTNSPASWAWNFGDGATSTSQNPSHTYNAAGTYTVTLTATNTGGSDDEVKTNYITVNPVVVIPTVLTVKVVASGETTLSANGNVTADGGNSITARGFCWNTIGNPIVSGNHTTNGSGTGTFTGDISGLVAYTTYYVRAYATNSAGTAYGEQMMVKTWQGHIADVEGNNYPTMIIGDQTWMVSNLISTTYKNGHTITTGLNNTEWQNATSGAYASYNNETSNVEMYGRLYNWYAVADPRGLCPDGWHVPSDDDWKNLETYLGMSDADLDQTGYRGTDEGGKLKETGNTHWNSPNTGATDEYSFTALPGGNRDYSGTYQYLSNWGYFWTSTEYAGYTGNAYSRSLAFNDARIARFSVTSKQNGFSVRCIKNQEITQPYADFPFSENFDNNWVNKNDVRDVPSDYWVNTPATGSNSWSRDDDGEARGAWGSLSGGYTPSGALSTSHSARFHSYGASAGLTGSLDLYINLNQTGNKVLKFWYNNFNGTDQLTVKVSSNGGATFGDPLQILLNQAEWAEYIVPLGNITGTQTVIRFEATSDWGYSDIGIDQVSVQLGTSIHHADANLISVYPNPFSNKLLVEAIKPIAEIALLNTAGYTLMNIKPGCRLAELETTNLPQGFFLMHIRYNDGSLSIIKVIHQ